MNNTEKMMKEIERVTLRGNADKETIRILSSIIYDLEQRIVALETPKTQATPAKVEPAVEEPKVEEAPKSPRRVTKTEDK